MGSKIIIHSGRCGSTLLFNVLDRYYRAKHNNDKSLGTLESISDRQHFIVPEGPDYLGLNEFMCSDFIKAKLHKVMLVTRAKIIKGEPTRRTLQQTDGDWEKRSELFKLLLNFAHTYQNKSLLMKYPLLAGKATFGCDQWINVERKDLKAQARSMYLSFTTGRYHVKAGDNKASRYAQFEPSIDVLEAWTADLMKAKMKYKEILDQKSNVKTYYYEDFVDLSTHEILEMYGIKDWQNYLEPNFKISTGKVWT
jgi:hypothetical protein